MIPTLTDRQRIFIDAITTDPPAGCCAAEAARRAGYAWPEKQGPRLLRFPAVRAEVDRRWAAYAEGLRDARKRDLLDTWTLIYPGAPYSKFYRKRRRRRPNQ